MIIVICAILTIAIKDLELRLNNSNLPLRKNTICFKTLVKKQNLVSKQLMYYISNINSLYHKNIYLS